jgi:hypothetical protein
MVKTTTVSGSLSLGQSLWFGEKNAEKIIFFTQKFRLKISHQNGARQFFRRKLAKIRQIYPELIDSWGRCYDHNFLQFSTIFGEKIGVFLKNQCYDQNFA